MLKVELLYHTGGIVLCMAKSVAVEGDLVTVITVDDTEITEDTDDLMVVKVDGEAVYFDGEFRD